MMMKMLHDSKPSRYNTNTLQNTDKFDSIETKNNQVSINLIDNAIVDYHNELNDIIDDESNKKTPYIDLIKGDKNNKQDERTTCKIYITLSTIQRLQKWHKRKYEKNLGISKEVELILDEYLDKVEEQLEQETTASSSCIEYNYTTPRIDVLNRLLDLSNELKNNSSNIFSKSELLVIVEKQRGIRDVRMVKKYHECLLVYSIRMKQANIIHDQYNMLGFRSGVLHLIQSRDNQKTRKIKDSYDGLTLKETTEEGIGVSPTMQEIINESSKQAPSLHDIRIKFPSKQIHQNAIQAGKTPHSRNKGIFEKGITISKYITANIAIYPNSVTVELACTYNPITCDAKGAEELLAHVTFISDFLSRTYQAEDIPNLLEWIVAYYHLNQDGMKELSGEKLHRTISDIMGKGMTEYAKSFPDGKQKMRSESIITPNISLEDQLKRMRIFGNYFNSNNEICS